MSGKPLWMDSQKKEILGKIEYKIISVDEALLDINLFVSASEFKDIMRKNKEQNYIYIIVDRSGSMSGVIEHVKQCTIKCV